MSKTDTKFVHLHAHSHYSLLDGLGKVPDIVGRVKELGMDSLAITDHGVLYGAVDFYEQAKAKGVKPIIGVEAYVAPGSRHSKTSGQDSTPYHLILLAQNRTGYQNLLKLVTAAHLEGFYYKPRIDWELLEQHSEGLICTSACLNGELAKQLRNGDEKAAREVVERYAKLFGPERYYLEVQDNPTIPEQGIVNKGAVRLAKEVGLGLVATNDAHYVLPDDEEAQDVLVCVQTARLMEDSDRLSMRGEDFSLRSPEDMATAFTDTPEAISNSVKIAEMCDLELKLGGMILPKFQVPEGQDEKGHLRNEVYQGLVARYGGKDAKPLPEGLTPDKARLELANRGITEVVLDRLDYEMGVIEKMGYESYFLIVSDFVNYAKDREIFVGPGRGSAAGSIVAYALNITNLDPIEYDLLFERFLNPDRISMPDIDIDFADDRRGEVIQYVADKYGSDHVAQIITFGTMAARAAVRDVGRVLGVPYGTVDQVAKLIPFGMPLAEARRVPDLRELADANPEVTRLLDLAERLEGVCRHAGMHAAGVVIGDRPLVNYVPLQYGTKGDTSVITQYSMLPLEKIGLLKMDFLGLSNLTILRNAIEIIEAVHGDTIDLDAIPLDDAKTYKLLSAGQTHGVFQLESDGMRRYIKELKPSAFEDIIAMVALYRPGPMQNIDTFIRRKHGREQVRYIHPKVEDALKETYGVIVYQEQVMQISKDLAGFTGGQADTLRKAMGKKIASMMAEMRDKFIDGVVVNGESKELGKKIFAQFEEFAQYGFVKAHAACYAMIAYQTAYLKAHYSSPYMAALMTSEQENLDKLSDAINECAVLGIDVVPPDVNESYANFAVAADKQAIRFGLDAIKNLGRNTVEAIIKTRKAKGPFKDLNDFLCRLPDGTANKKSLEALIKAGALDSLADRGRMLAGLEAMARFSAARAAESRSGQNSLFGDTEQHASFTLPLAGSVDLRQKLEWERELLGMYVSEHPLDEFKEVTDKFPKLRDIEQFRDGAAVSACGLIAAAKRITTRRGEPMAFITLEDTVSSIEVIIFPGLYVEIRDLLAAGTMVSLGGKVSHKDGEVKILANTMAALTTESVPENPQAAPLSGGPVIENITSPSASSSSASTREEAGVVGEMVTVELRAEASLGTLEQVKDILDAHQGESPVCLVINSNGQQRKLKLAHAVRYSQALIEELRRIDQSAQVRVGADS